MLRREIRSGRSLRVCANLEGMRRLCVLFSQLKCSGNWSKLIKISSWNGRALLHWKAERLQRKVTMAQ
eukprot:12325738-Karenia_brevis.AAC.1